METGTKSKPAARNINKPGYILFLLAAIYYMIQRDFSAASGFMGSALIFDPFNILIPFNKRPVYQQLWLLVHLSITLALVVLMVIGK
jgi:hypothetical protein